MANKDIQFVPCENYQKPPVMNKNDFTIIDKTTKSFIDINKLNSTNNLIFDYMSRKQFYDGPTAPAKYFLRAYTITLLWKY